MVITFFVVVGALLLAMIGSAIINPQNKPETADEDRARIDASDRQFSLLRAITLWSTP